jgi:hypothetical protein
MSRFERFFGKGGRDGRPHGESSTPQSEPPYQPSGSPLADAVNKAVEKAVIEKNETERLSSLEAARKAEQNRQEAATRKKETTETKTHLQEVFTSLEIAEALQDVKKNVWKGGILVAPNTELYPKEEDSYWNVTAGSKGGLIRAGLQFSYPSATTGYYHTEIRDYGIVTGTSEGYSPKIYEVTQAISVGVSLDKSQSREALLFSSPVLKDWNRGFREKSFLLQQDNLDEAREWLREMLIEDSKNRIMRGLLPLSLPVAQGQEQVRSVIDFAKKNGYKLTDERGKR